MAVYREGFKAYETYMNKYQRIFTDACDVGVPITDNPTDVGNQIMQMLLWYKNDETRKLVPDGVQIDVELLDEWALSDGRKTEKEAEFNLKLTYYKVTNSLRRSENYLAIPQESKGWITVERI
jgi:hypothetical protein